METYALKSEPRNTFGKGAARKLRQQNRVPVAVYREGGEAQHLSVSAEDVELLASRVTHPNIVISLECEGQDPILGLIKDANRHPVSRKLLHIDVYRILEDQDVVVEIPVKTTGRAEGETFGGKLRWLRRTIAMRCLPANIPADYTIDISPLNIGDLIRVSSLTSPENAKIVFAHDYNVLTLVGKRGARAKAQEEAEAEG